MGFVPCRVARRIDWCGPGLFSLVLDATPEPFEPGQFVNLALDLEGARVKRAYSLANLPGESIEVYVVAVPGGRLSPRLASLREGDPLEFDPRPHGFFVASEVPSSRELWMFATGTGLGPYLAMLRRGDVFARHETVVLVHSVREAAHLGYRAELERLAATIPSFRYLPTLTRAEHADLLHGRVTSVVASGELEARAGILLEPSRAHIMLCGNPTMLDDLGALLLERGLRKHRRRSPGHLTTEAYW
ncbi:MAG: ferredoxin--NADP reductase [Deltaproteobacteria bacterium]|nr:ferredoxin--NADP reductase [Deltaproteobacteria bacterium]